MKIPQILQTPINPAFILFAGGILLAGCGKTSNNNNPKPGANNSSVFINGQKATLVSATGTQLTVTVPSLAGTGKVTVTSGSNTLTGPVFTYDTPAL